MSIKKSIAGVIAGSVVAGAALVAAAGPALANDEGQVLNGQIYFLTSAGGFDANSAATVRTSGDGNTRFFSSMSVAGDPCPSSAVNLQGLIRIPQVGVPVNDQDEVPISAQSDLTDAAGRFYTARGDYADKSAVLAYLATQPNSTADLPFLAVCRDAGGLGVGYYEMALHMSGTTTDTLTWSVPTPDMAVFMAGSTTSLTASAASVEAGSPVDLTAAVGPVDATGAVEFFAGTTSLGTAPVSAGSATLSTSALPVGVASVTAVYSGDASHAGSTSAAVAIEVTAVPQRQTTTTITVSPDSGEVPAARTFTVAVSASTGLPNGVVTIKDNGVAIVEAAPVVDGAATVTVNSKPTAGEHAYTAVFVGTAPYGASQGSSTASYTAPTGADLQDVMVTMPDGALTITTPYHKEYTDEQGVLHPANVLDLGVAKFDASTSTYYTEQTKFEDIVVKDTRPSELGWTASVESSPFSSASDSFPASVAHLTDIAVVDHDPMIDASDVTTTVLHGLDTKKDFAVYPAGKKLGFVKMEAELQLLEIPSSVTSGVYNAVLTFTAA